MRIVVCGSRAWWERAPVRTALDPFPRSTEIIHGGAPGADNTVDLVARELGFTNIKIFRPDWKGLGKAAGLKRNLEMLAEKPDLVLAFWDGKSRGTGHTIANAEKQGIEVRIVRQS